MAGDGQVAGAHPCSPGPGMVPGGHMDRVMPACFNTAALTPASRQAA